MSGWRGKSELNGFTVKTQGAYWRNIHSEAPMTVQFLSLEEDGTKFRGRCFGKIHLLDIEDYQPISRDSI